MQHQHSDWTARSLSQLASIDRAGQRRATRSFDAFGPSGTVDGREIVSFASNDYLGLSSHPSVIEAAHAAIDRWGTGATASRLIVGHRPCHDELEAELATWKGSERALVFPTGYAANVGVLEVFGGADVTILSDELNHASIIDGCRASRADTKVFRHGDLDHLAALLGDATGATIVVSDSVFSMDGDSADVDGLAELCARHGALLVLDEAHAVLGPTGPAHRDDLDLVRVGTLSKTLGSLGGFVTGSSPFIELLVNRARPFIFTTALSPADAAAALAALRVVRSPEGDELRMRLRGLVDRLVPGHPSPIVPLVVGSEEAALDAAAVLLDRGLLVPAIRPPTVPPGTSRLRITPSAAHRDVDLDTLVTALVELGLR